MRIFNWHTKVKSIFFLLMIALVFTLIVPSNAAAPSYYYQYEGTGYAGFAGTNANCYFMVEYNAQTGEKTGNVLYAYCADMNTKLQKNEKYHIAGLASNQIKAILLNSSPVLTRAQITENVNASWVAEQFGTLDRVLSGEESITGSQYAVWHYTNGFSDEISDSYVNRHYQYLLSLPEESHTDYDGVDIRVTSAELDEDGNLNVSFSYTKPFDEIALSQDFEGADINYSDGSGTVFIPAASLGETIDFSITVSAVRAVKDAYILRSTEIVSQDLVAIGTDYIEASADVNISVTPTPTPTPTPAPAFTGSETAWAYGGNKAIEFSSEEIGLNNNNWGWTNGLLSEGEYEFDLYAGAGNNDLNKGTLVGKLIVEYRNGKVSVTYDLYSGFVLKEAHLHIGNDYLPKKGNGYKNAPGQFEYKAEFKSGTDSYEFVVNGIKSKIYIAAHAVVEGSNQGTDDNSPLNGKDNDNGNNGNGNGSNGNGNGSNGNGNGSNGNGNGSNGNGNGSNGSGNGNNGSGNGNNGNGNGNNGKSNGKGNGKG